MTNKEFYNILDAEIQEIIANNSTDPFIKKHRGSIQNQKAYGFLIWFVQFYCKQSTYLPFITEGDDDASCDIIFDTPDSLGQKRFFIIQSKWNSEKNVDSEIETKDIKYTLNDFETILRGDKKITKNIKLASKLEGLKTHIEQNGVINFIFISLCNKNEKINENITSFERSNKKTTFEIFDINKIKKDYIDVKFKELTARNPIDSNENPENSTINISIERLDRNDGNYIELTKPFEANTFLVKPKTIFELFNKYGFSLFYKNVRNPLIKSNFNKEIEKTILDNPAFFWYYNNGITGITNVLPIIRKEAKSIELTGLQIINGAQTIYSVYSAYSKATPSQRQIIDREALLSLRIVKSGGKDFDLRVARFTNSQNPVTDRDFYANEDIQVRLQNESFDTPVWYEKRNGEFRSVPKGIVKMSNHLFALAYLSYFLQEPTLAIKSIGIRNELKKNILFISHKDYPDGLYEKVFNASTNFVDMLASFYLFDLIIEYLCDGEFDSVFRNNALHNLAIFKDLFPRFLKLKGVLNANVSKYIIKAYEADKIEEIVGIMAFINRKTYSYLKLVPGKSEDRYFKFLTSKSNFEQVKEKVDKSRMTIELLKEDFADAKKAIKRRKAELQKESTRTKELKSL